jgi:HTH-type transcriptional regulator/antitoxin HigA
MNLALSKRHKMTNTYNPDVVSPPGETLAEVLQERGMTQAALAELLGRPKEAIRDIIHGKVPMTKDDALRLARVLRVPADFWIMRERQYSLFLEESEAQNRRRTELAWLRQIPIAQMIKRGWIPETQDKQDQMHAILAFFGVASVDEWQRRWMSPDAAFRRSPSFEGAPGAVAAWLRQGELEADQISCAPFDKQAFRGVLERARSLTRESPGIFQPLLAKRCAEAGVAVVFLPELPKCRVSGVTRWLSPAKATIQLSLRYRADDHLWFSFFHEAGHILLHGKRDVFVEEEGNEDNEKEEQANCFAADSLILRRQYQKLLTQEPFSKSKIMAFAEKIGIAPGIVVGRLQHDGHLSYSHCNNLKQRFRLSEL